MVVGIFWRRTGQWWLFLVVLMVLPWLYNLAVLCYRRMSVRYLLTTQRFIHERGILRRINDRIEVLDMNDITVEQRLWERLSGVGTIRIASHDRSDPLLSLPGIENVQQVATLFDNARLAKAPPTGIARGTGLIVSQTAKKVYNQADGKRIVAIVASRSAMGVSNGRDARRRTS